MYWNFQIACFIPLIIDAVARIILLAAVFGHSDHEEIQDELLDDKFQFVAIVGDILCVIPFLLRAVYIRPSGVTLEQLPRVCLRLIELFSVSRISRQVKDIPAAKAIQITLMNAFVHLAVPIFFFFMFNVFFGVIVYFLDPCYSIEYCPWKNLFDASFFSVVTMSTSKQQHIVSILISFFLYLLLMNVIIVRDVYFYRL